MQSTKECDHRFLSQSVPDSQTLLRSCLEVELNIGFASKRTMCLLQGLLDSDNSCI